MPVRTLLRRKLSRRPLVATFTGTARRRTCGFAGALRLGRRLLDRLRFKLRAQVGIFWSLGGCHIMGSRWIGLLFYFGLLALLLLQLLDHMRGQRFAVGIVPSSISASISAAFDCFRH